MHNTTGTTSVLQTEGRKDILRVNKLLATCDVEVRPNVTSKREIIFFNPYARFFADSPVFSC